MSEANGDTLDVEVGLSELRGNWLTYKRRKYTKIVEDGSASAMDAAETRFMGKNSLDQAAQEGASFATITSSDCSLRHQRNIVLEQICQSLKYDGGLKKCIHDALSFCPGNGNRASVKDHVTPCEAESKCSSIHDGPLNAMKGSVGLASSRLLNETNNGTVSDLCCGTFFEIIMSDEFAKLCCLLHDNGMKAEKLFNFGLINFKMKESTCEISPLLFHSDLQQVWTKFEKVGRDIVAHAKSLSEKTMASFSKHGDGPGNGISAGRKHEFITEGPDIQKDARAESSSFNKLHACQQCGEKVDGRNGLVCDSCEKMYHVSCIRPPVKEIPVRSWFCTNCTSNEIGSPHDNCVVCQRIDFLQSLHDEEDEHMHNKSPEALEETSKEKVLQYCKVCRDMIINCEDYKTCGHSVCPHKFYHAKCLTSTELESHARCWYCPSCLCRACLVDQDDHKIVLCDGCDHGYHLYCMQPPRDTIPRGAWFCTGCNVGIQRLRKAKSLYEKRKSKFEKSPVDGEPKTGNALSKSCVVDMLLNAAITLKHEEKIQQQGD